jgi:putative endonuclease
MSVESGVCGHPSRRGLAAAPQDEAPRRGLAAAPQDEAPRRGLRRSLRMRPLLRGDVSLIRTGVVYLRPHPEELAKQASRRMDRRSLYLRDTASRRTSAMTGGAWLYILVCSDGSYYVGITRTSLEIRVAQHNAGSFRGYTASRRPVELIFSQWFDQITDAIENERKLKKWSRAKKEALIRGDFASLPKLAKRRSHHPSRRPPAAGSSG